MKNITHFLLLFFGFIVVGYSQPSLKLVTPRSGGWGGVEDQLEISNARLVVEPQGLYFQVDMYLEFAISPTYNYTEWKEVEYFFDLPKQAVVIDSWLWIENYISKGIILDADSASQVYEGIVNRQTDPSILLKRSPTRYELRIYPITSQLPRTVKISYLVPAEVDKEYLFSSLPLENIMPYLSFPFISLDVVQDSGADLPRILEKPDQVFTTFVDPDLGPMLRTSIAKGESIHYNTLGLKSPIEEGIYAGFYPTGLYEGIYEVAMVPSFLEDDTSSRNVLLLIENQHGNCSNPDQVLTIIHDLAGDLLTEKDSFNFVFLNSSGEFSTAGYSWLPVDSTNLSNSINIPSHVLHPYHSLSNILHFGLDLLDSIGGGTDIYLFSSSDGIRTKQVADQTLSNLGPLGVPIHTAYFQDQDFIQVYDPSLGMYVEQKFEYFYQKLAENSGGTYTSLESTGNSLYKLLQAPFRRDKVNFDIVDMDVSPQQGFSFDQIELGQLTYPFSSIRESGRYYGVLPIEIQLFTVKNQIFHSYDTVLSIASLTALSSASEKTYTGAYFQSEIGQMTQQEATEYSVANRMLCQYTAFLCLEDSVQQGLVSSDPFVWVSIEEELEELRSSVLISPNPFRARQRISIDAEWLDQSGTLSMELFDTQGRLLRSFEPGQLILTGEAYSLDWDGTSLPEGTYTLVVTTDHGVISRLISKR